MLRAWRRYGKPKDSVSLRDSTPLMVSIWWRISVAPSGASGTLRPSGALSEILGYWSRSDLQTLTNNVDQQVRVRR